MTRSNKQADRRPSKPIAGARYSRIIAALAIVFLIGAGVNTLLTKRNGAAGRIPGEKAPPFAVPRLDGHLDGDPDIARHKDEGENGNVPACKERGREILNLCALYEQGPVVLALFVDKGSCPRVLQAMRTVAPSFPQVSFAAVAIKSNRAELADLKRYGPMPFPVGFDRYGVLASLYEMATCPQVSFIYPGGVMQSAALLNTPSTATLRTRVTQLVAASAARAGKRRAARGGTL